MKNGIFTLAELTRQGDKLWWFLVWRNFLEFSILLTVRQDNGVANY